MHAVRSDGGHPTRPSQRAMGTAGYALSRSGRRSDPPRRFYRKTFLTTLSSQLRLGSSPERGRIGRTIFVFLHLFDGLLWRDHPLEAAVFVHGAKNKRCVPAIKGSTARIKSAESTGEAFCAWPPRMLSSTFAKRCSLEPRCVIFGSLP